MTKQNSTQLHLGVESAFPNILTDNDYSTFKNALIYSIVDIINLCSHLSSILLLSNVLTLEQEQALLNDLATVEAVSGIGINIPNSPPQREKKEEGRKLNTILGKKSCLNTKNEGFSGDSFGIERQFIREFIRQYYIRHNSIPPVDIVRDEYVSSSGYDKHDSRRVERFTKSYNDIVRTFNPDKLRKPGIFLRGDYITELKTLYPTKESLKELQSEINPYFKGKITHEDIAIAAGFYFCSLTQKLGEKASRSRSLTVAQNTMQLWFENLYENHKTARRCQTGSKVKVLREILIHIGWLKCVNESYYKGKFSRRHLLTKAFPRYSEFEKLVGEQTIIDWSTVVYDHKQVG